MDLRPLFIGQMGLELVGISYIWLFVHELSMLSMLRPLFIGQMGLELVGISYIWLFVHELPALLMLRPLFRAPPASYLVSHMPSPYLCVNSLD